MSHLLLTGASGTIGSALLAETLASPHRDGFDRITLLMRASSPAELQAKSERVWQFVGTEPPAGVNVAVADVEQPGLGLTESQQGELQSSVTHIAHCAGRVRMNDPLSVARFHHVRSAREVLQFAFDCPRLEKLDVVSTIGVAGRGQGTITEEPLDLDRTFHNSYEWAKAEAEQLYWNAIGKGLPLTLHRPSMVVGHSETGAVIHFQVFYYLCDFLTGRRTLGLCPRETQRHLDVVPVDYVARSILTSLTHSPWAGQVLHLCAGPQQSVSIPALRDKAREAYRQAGIRLPQIRQLSRRVSVIAATGASCLVPSRRVRKRLAALPHLLAYLGENQAFEVSRTRQVLGPTGLTFPSNSLFIDRVLRTYLQATACGHKSIGPYLPTLQNTPPTSPAQEFTPCLP